MDSDVNRAVLLAAGRGTRLGNLTLDCPKPMILVQDKPVLEHIVVGLHGAGVCRFLIVVGYRAEAIRDHFGDGSGLGIEIEYLDQPIPTGTGSAFAMAREFSGGEPIFGSYGDILTDFQHYHEILVEFRRRPCAAVLGINPVDDPSAGGAVFREESRVTRVVEKPPQGTGGKWNLAGVNIFGPETFDALDKITPSPRGEYEITSGIEILLAENREIRACEFHGFWSDVGTPETLGAAQSQWRA